MADEQTPDVLSVEERLAKIEHWLTEVDDNLLDFALRLQALEAWAKQSGAPQP